MRELTLPGRLILLPGLGSTAAVFDRQRKAFGDRLETPDFIPHQHGESVAAYAQRWARQLSRPGDKRPVFLGGVSFGGMLAQEMAMYLEPKPRVVMLIASTREPEQVTGVMQFAELMGRYVPTGSVTPALKALKLAFAMRDGLDDDGKKILLSAADQVDPAMTKWGASAAVGWSGFEPPAGYPPITQIHSRRDWVIKPPAEAPGVHLVEGYSHQLLMCSRTTINRFIFDSIMQVCPELAVDTPAIEDPETTAQRRLALEGAPAGTPLV